MLSPHYKIYTILTAVKMWEIPHIMADFAYYFGLYHHSDYARVLTNDPNELSELFMIQNKHEGIFLCYHWRLSHETASVPPTQQDGES